MKLLVCGDIKQVELLNVKWLSRINANFKNIHAFLSPAALAKNISVKLALIWWQINRQKSFHQSNMY